MNKIHNPVSAPQETRLKRELSRVISAAVVNQRFRTMLLSDPEAAVSAGYSGERFALADEEKARLARMRADSLAEFAAQIAAL
jgi:hypothetical protein